MKKTIQIHIGGGQFHIDEDAYSKLQQYLDALKKHFEKEGETGREIIADIEQRIAELLRNNISETKQAVTITDIDEIIRTLGTIEDFQYSEKTDTGMEDVDHHAHRKLYRDCDNNYFGGVAAGLGAYFNVDPVWIRLAFIALLFAKGIGLLIYIIMWLVVPKAVTTAQKLAMKGKPVTIDTIGKSISGEYNQIRSNFSTWRQSERTRDTFHEIIGVITTAGLAILKFILYIIGFVFLIIGSIFLAVLIMLIFGQFEFFHSLGIFHGWVSPDFSNWFSNTTHYTLLAVSLFVLIFIPIVSLIYAGIKIIFHINTRNNVLRATALTAWILALILFFTILFSEVVHAPLEAMRTESKSIPIKQNLPLYIDINDNLDGEHIVSYSIFNYNVLYDRRHDQVYSPVSLTLVPVTDQTDITCTVKKCVRNIGLYDDDVDMDELNYDFYINDSLLVLDNYFMTDEDDFWKFAKVVIELKIPVNSHIYLDHRICELFDLKDQDKYCEENTLTGKNCIMTREGLVASDIGKISR